MSLAGGALRLPKPLRGLGGWLGLALVITSGFFLDGAKLFPGPWALWPLLGLTLVLISAGPSGGNNDPKHTVTRLLSNKYLAWIGDHAYSLYLWHWPLLIFYLQIRSREAIGIRGAVVILAVTVVLAMLMYRYVETPLQRLSREQPVGLHRLNRVTVIAGASTLVIAGVTVA